MLTIASFRKRFTELTTVRKVTWDALGFYCGNGMVIPFGTDTKVLSTIFESMSAPIICQIAEENGYVVEGAPQTVYPDFTLSHKEGRRKNRIAIDIKTTYRNQSKIKFTLGSYTSFLRDGKKNILYPYAEYEHHFVIGFLYSRCEETAAKVYVLDKGGKPTCPYKDVQYFIQEKYKIVGLSPGSGNTANIGSFPTSDIRELESGNGPFASHGKEICDSYWRNYPRSGTPPYNSVVAFLAWIEKNKQVIISGSAAKTP